MFLLFLVGLFLVIGFLLGGFLGRKIWDEPKNAGEQHPLPEDYIRLTGVAITGEEVEYCNCEHLKNTFGLRMKCTKCRKPLRRQPGDIKYILLAKYEESGEWRTMFTASKRRGIALQVEYALEKARLNLKSKKQ